MRKLKVVDQQKWDRAKATLFIVSIVVTFIFGMAGASGEGEYRTNSWVILPASIMIALWWNLFGKKP
jgi:hypothetical protein